MPDRNPVNYDFAVILTDAIWAGWIRRTTHNEPFTKAECVKMIREHDATRLDTPKPEAVVSTRPRNVLIDALATLNGAKLSEVSPAMFAQSGKALADIKAICPAVTVEEIQKRAANYREKFPRVTLSPTALAKWWGDCGENAMAPAKPTKPKDYTRFM